MEDRSSKSNLERTIEGFNTAEASKECLMTRGGSSALCDSIGERDGPMAVAGVLVVALPILVTCRGCRELT
jgi:hypothetical protein